MPKIKQSILEENLVYSKISEEILSDLSLIPLPAVLKKYTKLIPHYELLGFINSYVSSQVSRQLLKDRVGARNIE